MPQVNEQQSYWKWLRNEDNDPEQTLVRFKERKLTNRRYLYIHLCCLLILIGCVSYCGSTNISNLVKHHHFQMPKFSVAIKAILCGCGTSFGIALLFLVSFRLSPKCTLIEQICILLGTGCGLIALLWNHSFNCTQISAICQSFPIVVVIVYTCVKCRRIKLATPILNEAVKVVRDIPVLYLQPFIIFIISGLLVVIWEVFNELIQTGKENIFINFTCWFNLFMLLWNLTFVLTMHQMILSGATVSWFFSRDKSDLTYAYLKSIHMTLRYHIGTISMGSLLFLITFVVKLFYQRIRSSACNPLGLRYLLYISRNAYTSTFIHGTDFMESGEKVFDLFKGNSLKVFQLIPMLRYLFFTGKMFVVIGVSCWYIYLTDYYKITSPIMYVIIFSYLAVYSLMRFYDVIVDALFVSICYDCQISDGRQHPYYRSANLVRFISMAEMNVQEINNPY